MHNFGHVLVKGGVGVIFWMSLVLYLHGSWLVVLAKEISSVEPGSGFWVFFFLVELLYRSGSVCILYILFSKFFL